MSILRITFINDDTVETGEALKLYKEFDNVPVIREEILRILREVTLYGTTCSAAPQALTAIGLVQHDGYTAYVHDWDNEVPAPDVVVTYRGQPRGDGNVVTIVFKELDENKGFSSHLDDEDMFGDAIAWLENRYVPETPSAATLARLVEVGEAMLTLDLPDSGKPWVDDPPLKGRNKGWNQKWMEYAGVITAMGLEWPARRIEDCDDITYGFRTQCCVKQCLSYLVSDLKRAGHEDTAASIATLATLLGRIHI